MNFCFYATILYLVAKGGGYVIKPSSNTNTECKKFSSK